MIRRVMGALGVIVSDAIEEWATKVTRQDLLDTIDDLTAKVHGLEDELDQLAQANAQLQSELFEAETELANIKEARGKDPDPFDLYGGGIWPEKDPESCLGVTPPGYCEQCGDQCVLKGSASNVCPTCYRSFTHCTCPF